MNISLSLVQKNNEGQGEGLHYLVLNTFFYKRNTKKTTWIKNYQIDGSFFKIYYRIRGW